VLEAPAGAFTLSARADRIDVRSDGILITDYKSSASLDPLKAKARNGYAPQLALEAAIALASGFAGVTAAPVLGLRYISSSGGEPPGADVDLAVKDTGALARGAEAGLARLIAEFDRDETPYRAIRRRSFSYDYDDYAHLARAAEWASVEPDEE
jgi:ATP-dependent helicase/nuclease subunit B